MTRMMYVWTKNKVWIILGIMGLAMVTVGVTVVLMKDSPQTQQVTTSSSVSDQEAEYRARKVDVPLPGGAKVQVTAGELSDAFKGIKEGIESGRARKEMEQRLAPMAAAMSGMVVSSHVSTVLMDLDSKEKTLSSEQLARYDHLKKLARECSATVRQRMHSYIPRGSKRDLAIKEKQRALLGEMSIELFRLAEMGERLSVLGTSPIYAAAREKSKSENQ